MARHDNRRILLFLVISAIVFIAAAGIGCSGGGDDNASLRSGDSDDQDDDTGFSPDDDTEPDDDDNDDDDNDDDNDTIDDDDTTPDDDDDTTPDDDDDTTPDDDDDTTPDDDDDTTPDDDDDNDNDDNDDDTVPPNMIGGIVLDAEIFLPVAAAEVELLDNTTGLSFDPPVTGETDVNGRFLLEVPDVEAVPDFVALSAAKTGYYGGISYDQAVGSEANGVLVAKESFVNELAGYVGVTQSTANGIVFGDVMWIQEVGNEAPVGCATASLIPSSGEIYYVNDNLVPTAGRDDTNPGNGVFVAFNVAPDGYSVSATVAGETESTAFPNLPAKTLILPHIEFLESSYPANPTPDDCDDDDDDDDNDDNDDNDNNDTTDDDTTDDDTTDDDDDNDDNDDDLAYEGFLGLKSAYGGYATADGYFIHLIWDAAPESSAKAVTYNIYESEDPYNFDFTTPDFQTAELQYRLTSLTANTFRCYIIYADHGAGEVETNSIVHCATAANVFYVDPVNGSASGAGTANDPFQTLTQAQTALLSDKIANVYLAEGVFADQTLGLINAQGGVYGGWHNETGKGVWTRDLDSYTTRITGSGLDLISVYNNLVSIDGITFQVTGAAGLTLTGGVVLVVNSVFDDCDWGIKATLSTSDTGIVFASRNRYIDGDTGMWAVTSQTSELDFLSYFSVFENVPNPIVLQNDSNGDHVYLGAQNSRFSGGETAIAVTNSGANLNLAISDNTIFDYTASGISISADAPGGDNRITISGNDFSFCQPNAVFLDSENVDDSYSVTVQKNEVRSCGVGFRFQETVNTGASTAVYQILNNALYGGDNGIAFIITNNGTALAFGPRITNNVIGGSAGNGVSLTAVQTGGTFSSSIYVANNDIFHNDVNGILVNLPVSVGGAPLLQNNIVLMNDQDILVSSGLAADRIAYNDFMTGGATGPGNFTADPLIANLPAEFDRAISDGTTSTLRATDESLYVVGEYIELGNDGIERVITEKSGNVITFSPAADDIVREDEVVFLWGDNADVKEDISLLAGSLCINAGNPEAAYNDVNGTRNDIGATGGPLYSEE